MIIPFYSMTFQSLASLRDKYTHPQGVKTYETVEGEKRILITSQYNS